MSIAFDHIVVVAATLSQGVDYIHQTLGVEIPPGGEHEKMGTHNHVMQLGSGTYLEVIAINPDAGTPGHPRWFDMDNPLLHQRLKESAAFMHWVINVEDFGALAGFDPTIWGTPTPMTRGNLSWSIALPGDGRLPGGGLLPTVIQWHSPHPAPAMADTGCRLEKLVIHHPNESWLDEKLRNLGVSSSMNIAIETRSASIAHMEATISTPSGTRVLQSH